MSDSGRESLHSLINHLYGEDAFQLIRRLEKLRKKKIQLLCSLTFLMRCRDSGIIPRFLRLKRLFSTSSSRRIYDRTEFALLRERIHDTRRHLAINDRELLSTHLLISNKLHWSDWDRVDRFSHTTLMSVMQSTTARHKKKFYWLIKKKKLSPPSLDVNRTVVNLSDQQLSQAEISLLEKGLNFATTPAKVPTEDIIANIEAGIRNLPPETAEEIRLESSRILKRAKAPKSNINREQRVALKNLKAHKDVIILSADKGNATIVMNSVDYHRKITDLLDPKIYKKLNRDPTARHLRKTNQLIQKSPIPDDVKRNLKKSEALSPRLYGLPKIHKQNVPLRPIVSAIGSPTYSIAKYLTNLLQPYVGNTDTFIKNSSHFIGKLHNLILQPNDLLVSFDVVSLFTMVPVSDVLDLIKNIFSDDIVALFHQVLTTTYFQWDHEFYEQVDGVAMGSPLSPVVANFYMEFFEEKALCSAPFKPSCWLRYVDDTFVIWNHGEVALAEFLFHLNSCHPNIKFTVEKEKNCQLPFLDVLVTRKDDCTFGYKVYRKPTHTDRYLHKESNHHPRQKRAVLKTLIHRATRICEPRFLNQELHHLSITLQANGYTKQEIRRALRPKFSSTHNAEQPARLGTAFLPYIKTVTDRIAKLLLRHNISTVFKPTHQIRHLLRSPKDSRDKLSGAGVYKIPCSCGAVYIGTTQRSIKTRLTEHKRNCRLGHTEKSAVAEHAFEDGDHAINFDGTEVISSMVHFHARLNREAIEIFKHPSNFNRKEEVLRLNKSWLPALRNLKQESRQTNHHHNN